MCICYSCFNPDHDEVYSIQHYVIKFVSDLRQVVGFLGVLRFLPPSITDRHDITGILLKVALNTIKQTNKLNNGTTHCVCHVISHGLVYYLIFK
jgi:hypothetical protein